MFENMWTQHLDFVLLAQGEWGKGYRFMRKLKLLKERLKSMEKEVFGHVGQLK